MFLLPLGCLSKLTLLGLKLLANLLLSNYQVASMQNTDVMRLSTPMDADVEQAVRVLELQPGVFWAEPTTWGIPRIPHRMTRTLVDSGHWHRPALPLPGIR